MGELKLLINEDLPLRDLVYHSIRSAILKGDLKPEDRLMEMHPRRHSMNQCDTE